jgi:hypothetical protein
VIAPLPFFWILHVIGSPLSLEMRRRFTLRMMSVTSSYTPSSESNSCAAPWMRTAVTAVPSIDDSSTRRRPLPIVWPKPCSKGSITKRPYSDVNVSLSGMTLLGSSKLRQRILMDVPSFVMLGRGRFDALGRHASDCS